MSACLYCGKEAGVRGMHPECAPHAKIAEEKVVAALRLPPEARPRSEVRPPIGVSQPTGVRIIDIDMPFGSMVNFMVKWALASIPALIILMVFGFVIAAIFGAIGAALRG